MRSATYVLTSKKRKVVEAARAKDEKDQEEDEAPSQVGKGKGKRGRA
jgi:hypothetical protein